MTKQREQQILDSWQRNAQPWVRALERGAIVSRVTATNRAIVAAIARLAPQRVLDVGCGEGWLLRELAALGVAAEGVDAVPELVATARAKGAANCHCLSYQQLATHPWASRFDVAVCNFSLLGESLEGVLRALAALLTPGGRVLVQTLHPCFTAGAQGYQRAWLEGSWQGMPGDLRAEFGDAPPWYFRRLSDWLQLFAAAGFVVTAIDEPAAEVGGEPLSIIFELCLVQ